MATVYGLIDPRTGLLRYIGVTNSRLRTRLANHCNEARRGAPNHRCRWIRQILASGLRPLIASVEECSDTDGRLEEQFHIALARADGIKLVNRTDGGDGAPNLIVSDATRARMSRVRKGMKRSETTRLRISEALKRYERTETHRKNLGASLTGIPCKEHTKEISRLFWTGRKRSVEDVTNRKSSRREGLGDPWLRAAMLADIRLRMLSLQLSIGELSKRSGTHRNSIHLMFAGSWLPSTRILSRISEAL
jgi:hypothetical protein